MSKHNYEMIWQPDKVLPYLLSELKQKIESITPVESIYLFGSRARIPVKDWNTLAGKDWDVWVITKFPIKNSHIWTNNMGYYIDLKISTRAESDYFFGFGNSKIEIYPKNELDIIF